MKEAREMEEAWANDQKRGFRPLGRPGEKPTYEVPPDVWRRPSPPPLPQKLPLFAPPLPTTPPLRIEPRCVVPPRRDRPALQQQQQHNNHNYNNPNSNNNSNNS